MSHNNKIRSVIAGTGCYIPERIVTGENFLSHTFFDQGLPMEKENSEIIAKFSEITEIVERRYVNDDSLNSDIGTFAAQLAIDDAGIDKEQLDHIIFAHNFGDTSSTNNRIDMLPALAAKVKAKLGIENPDCVAYDVIFGCPGWVQGSIQADYLIRSGDAQYVLVIGAETLSRNIDAHDRDSMIFSDGAGAVIYSSVESEIPVGIITHKTQTFSGSYASLLTMGCSYNPAEKNGNLYLKMNGRKLYEFAVVQVPRVVKMAIDKAGISPKEIDIVFIHQANGKMDNAIMKRLFKLYDIDQLPDNLVPMTIGWLGNSSVATIPTLIDLVRHGKVDDYSVKKGDYALFASVGAGMHINCIVYRF